MRDKRTKGVEGVCNQVIRTWKAGLPSENRSLTVQDAFSQTNTAALDSKGDAKIKDSQAQQRRMDCTHTELSSNFSSAIFEP